MSVTDVFALSHWLVPPKDDLSLRHAARADRVRDISVTRAVCKQPLTCHGSRFYMARMMTSSNENIFRITGPLCGEFSSPGEFPTQRPVTLSFDVFFDQRLNKRLSKQPGGWWFETPSWSLWRQCNEENTRDLDYISNIASDWRAAI